MSRKKNRRAALRYERAEFKHLNARREETADAGVLLTQRLLDALATREQRVTLPYLTPQRCVQLFEHYRRGEFAPVALEWHQMEQVDYTLFPAHNRRQSALERMRWAVEADADAVGEDPALAELAEQQRKAALALLAKVDNLDSALVKLGEADFYGLAALEVCGSLETRMRWEVIEPWHLYQPLPNGPVFYNEQADTIPQRAEELERESVIIRTAPAMHLPVMFLISRMSHSEEQWDAFIDTYGLPNIFFELPAAMDERRALELDAIVKRLTGDGRGTMPNGTKIQTVETQQRDGTLFEQRGKWCRDAIISLVLGGTLTMETEAGSGTLAGNAHADSFAELCEGSAAGIGAAVDEQFLRPLLRKVFPNQPILVSFEFRPVDAEDAQQVAQTLATLKTAGWQVSAETASEMLGFEVQEAPEPQQPAAPYGMPFGNTAPAAGVVTNAADTPAEEAPLTKDELDALALVQNAMDPDVLHQKAAAIAGRLYEAMQTGKRGETVANDSAGDSLFGKLSSVFGDKSEFLCNSDECKAKDPETCWKHGLKNAGFTDEEIALMGELSGVEVQDTVAKAREEAQSGINARRGEVVNTNFKDPKDNTTLQISATINARTKGAVFNKWRDTVRELTEAGFCDETTAEKLHFAAGAKIAELFETSVTAEWQPISQHGQRVKDEALHFYTPFKASVDGEDKLLIADISILTYTNKNDMSQPGGRKMHSLSLKLETPDGIRERALERTIPSVRGLQEQSTTTTTEVKTK